MLKKLRSWLHPDSAHVDGPYRSRSLPLPAGTIVAEQGLRHLHDAPGVHTVTALLDEAYVVVQLDPHRRWYATWQPYLGNWELLHLDAEDEHGTGPAQTAAAPRRVEASAH
ncbi:MAG: hypothetical protein ACHQIO_03760 [Nevskiales bacterium]